MAFAVDLTGTILDRRYRLVGLLGKGGMGYVYEAMHVALDQRVAVKVLHPRYAYEERFRERFLQEARAASKIKHPNVVEIKDFGDTPDGSVYFAMEYLGGHDVGAELQEHGALPWPRVRHILLQAAGALGAAHAKHIIHRDIKPGNCFLIEDEAEGRVDVVKLLDFGIAKVGSDSHADAQGKGLTGTGEVFGTASYMSPEQARGQVLDARSDMYSLGIMAYEMLVGQVPFTGVNAIHVITQHLRDRPEPLRTYDARIPAVVEALVLKMLAKEPRDRYASMAEIEQALRGIPEDGGVGGRRTRLWSSPGDVRVPPSGPDAAGSEADAERTQAVVPKAAAGRGVVKRTVVSTERPPSPAARVAPAEPAAVVVAPARAQTAPAAAAMPMAVAAPVAAETPVIPPGWPVAARAEGTNPPPSRDPAASTWPPSTASTGPYMRLGDTGTETRPHSLEALRGPGISARLLLVVGLLVVLVGGVSVLGTMAILSKREPAPAEPAAVESPADAGAAVTEEGALEREAAVPEVEVPEAAVPEVEVLDVGAPSPVPSANEVDIEVDDVVVDEPEVEAAPVAADQPEEPAAPKVPKYETEKCAKVREAAERALEQPKFVEVAKLAKQRDCWPPAQQVERRRMQVHALIELGRFEECVAVGSKAKDPTTQKWTETCRKRLKKP